MFSQKYTLTLANSSFLLYSSPLQYFFPSLSSFSSFLSFLSLSLSLSLPPFPPFLFHSSFPFTCICPSLSSFPLSLSPFLSLSFLLSFLKYSPLPLSLFSPSLSSFSSPFFLSLPSFFPPFSLSLLPKFPPNFPRVGKSPTSPTPCYATGTVVC